MDIDFILNGKKPKKQKTSRDPLLDLFSSKPKQFQGGLMELFTGQGHPRPGDRVTKSQRKVLRNKSSLFGDWDGDGVINGLDCQPRNKKKHAWSNPVQYYNPKGKIVNMDTREAYDMRSRYTQHSYKPSKIKLDRKQIQDEYEKAQDKFYEDRMDELKMEIQHGIPMDNSQKPKFHDYRVKNYKQKVAELRKEGIIVKPPKNLEFGYDDEIYVESRFTPKRYKQVRSEIMQPTNSPRDISSKKLQEQWKKASSRKESDKVRRGYVKELSQAIKSKTKKVPMISMTDREIDKSQVGEGRHRILAAQKLGLRTIPVFVEKRSGHYNSKTYDKFKGEEVELKEE